MTVVFQKSCLHMAFETGITNFIIIKQIEAQGARKEGGQHQDATGTLYMHSHTNHLISHLNGSGKLHVSYCNNNNTYHQDSLQDSEATSPSIIIQRPERQIRDYARVLQP